MKAWVKSNLPTVLVDKLLFRHNHTHSILYCLSNPNCLLFLSGKFYWDTAKSVCQIQPTPPFWWVNFWDTATRNLYLCCLWLLQWQSWRAAIGTVYTQAGNPDLPLSQTPGWMPPCSTAKSHRSNTCRGERMDSKWAAVLRSGTLQVTLGLLNLVWCQEWIVKGPESKFIVKGSESKWIVKVQSQSTSVAMVPISFHIFILS